MGQGILLTPKGRTCWELMRVQGLCLHMRLLWSSMQPKNALRPERESTFGISVAYSAACQASTFSVISGQRSTAAFFSQSAFFRRCSQCLSPFLCR